MAGVQMETDIDDSLYSRQRYVLGDSAMQSLAQSSVLIYGLGGLGAEIAKNIALAGVKLLTLHDSQPSTYQDLGSQFFLRLEDVQASKNRAEASAARVAELNPYVSVNTVNMILDDKSDLTFLDSYKCVVLTEGNLAVQLKVNEYCRAKAIKFISAAVYGVFCWSFCDFGPSFEVVDANGEEPREVFISEITKGNPGVVTTLDNKMHGFQDGDTVTFKELKGMDALNGKLCKIEVKSPYKFSICDTSGQQFTNYTAGGIAVQVKVATAVKFESLESQLRSPSLVISDLSNMDAPANIHVGMMALHRYFSTYGRLPALWTRADADQLLQLAKEINAEMKTPLDKLDELRLRHLAYTSRGCFAPLCAFLGGVVAQEALKALTGKFTPLNQWLYLDSVDILAGLDLVDNSIFQPRRGRYDALRMCIGEDLCQKLAETKLFMVGCGAIGCEMLKNYALLGVGSSRDGGKLTITDNDLIEKSNLNRQFLFRSNHIRMPKSTTAAASVKEINPDLNIDAQQYKVCPDTESTVYNDAFYQNLDLVVNALDNVEARRYMDSRCVTNGRALLESGTMGAKGHVQVIVPHLTESYSSQRDPVDEDVPYCTLKSFPATIDHCIEWARDKFETIFAQKPALFNKFGSEHPALNNVVLSLENGHMVDGSVTVSKLLYNYPLSWNDCVALGRIKFEKYFNHKAQQLLHAFPIGTTLKDGKLADLRLEMAQSLLTCWKTLTCSSFWQLPKRPPNPLSFDPNNQLHYNFVVVCARLYADVYNISYTAENLSSDAIISVLTTVNVPQFEPKNKTIVVDENAKKPEAANISGDELKMAAQRLQQAVSRLPASGSFQAMTALSFEKDNDLNGHIDFISAASNLRASMYGIELSDRLKIKRIAGRIVPAIATTTAAVAGLIYRLTAESFGGNEITIELIKVIKKCPIEQYKNAFLNLALPMFVFSEPASAVKTTLSTGAQFTIWDRWELHGNKAFTVKQFIETLQAKYHTNATLIAQGVKMVYFPLMPGHIKRLGLPIQNYLKISSELPYVDLMVSYQKSGVPSPDEDQDEMGPPVRYYHGS